MSKKRKTRGVREAPQKYSQVYLTDAASYDFFCVEGYRRLDKCPEIFSACWRIAELISSMTIYLMENGEKGDIRIQNELSRLVDISPSRYMTRKAWMSAIVMNILLHGNGNAVVLPVTRNGLIDDLRIIPPDQVMFIDDFAGGYTVQIGDQTFQPEDVLHFTYNQDPSRPWLGTGIRPQIADVARNLRQAAETQRGFMSSKWKPSLIIKVDGMVEEFAGKEGREKLLGEYIETSEAGQPLVIPAEQFSVEQIRPLSLQDLAIADSVKLDKKTVAAVLGVPAFILGEGAYTPGEWNNFINSTVRPIAQSIEQTLTKGLIISPRWYWKFNISSLYSYDLKQISDVYGELYVRGIVTGNEVRDKISMSPLEGLDELVILENYIPLGKIGDQLKLGQKGEGDD